MSSIPDPSGVISDNSQSTSSNLKGSKNIADQYQCEVCKVPVGLKNKSSHEYGKKHQNNLKKISKKQTTQVKPSTTPEEKSKTPETHAASKDKCNKPSSPTTKKPNADQNSSKNSKTKSSFSAPPSIKSLDDLTPDVIQWYKEHHPPVTSCERNNLFGETSGEQFNPDMYNQNNRNVLQTRHHWEGDSDSRRRFADTSHVGYKKREHYDNFGPPRRSNFNQPDNRQLWQHWKNDSWNNRERNDWFPQQSQYKKDNRYFERPVPDVNQHNPFVVDTQGYDGMENFCPLDKAHYPQNFNSDAPLGSSTTRPKEPSEKASTNLCEDKSTKKNPKPLKRKNQSVRAITNASRSSIDSDDTPDGDKQEKSRNSVSENSTGKRIAHWINPSNPKDEAEVRRLVTELAKSKKKENLLRLQQESDIRKDSTTEKTSTETDSSKKAQTSSPSTQSSSEKKRSSSLESRSSISSPTVTKSTKSKRSSVPSQASPLTSTNEGKKRKSSTELPSSKVRRYTSPSELDACLDAAIRGSFEFPSAAVTNTKNHPLPEKSLPETTVPYVKTEPVDTPVDFADTLNLNEFLQNQGMLDNNSTPEATMTPVESLINLFASGNVVTIKKEFDDPFIDAIRTVDTEVLNRICDNGSTAKKKTPDRPLPSVTGSLKTILKQLQKIADREQKVKEKMQEADLKIQEYQALLDEWKTQKIKFQTEEEYLGHQRNTLVKSMNDLVADVNPSQDIPEDSSSVIPAASNSLSNEVPSNHARLLDSLQNTEIQPDSDSPNNESESVNSQTLANVPVAENVQTVEEEIAILPIPRKSQNKDVPVIDLDDVCTIEDSSVPTSNVTLPCEDTIYNKLSEFKVLAAHEVIVNQIQVFEDFLYTCSNDSTAKRFNLKNLSETVIYQHEKKNVNNLCIEKVNGKTLVFTSCSASNFVTVFDAEDGTILNTFKFSSIVSSLCRGRDKIFVGLRDGSIFTCTMKEQEELVNIGDPIKTIALTYQGTIRILVTLAFNGSVSIRDAERNGLLIRNVKTQKTGPIFMTVNGDCIYLSGSGFIIVVEIGSARIVQNYEFPTPYTSLTVYQGLVFTTSYSGLVRCHPKEKDKHVTVYYGAGNTALTCINVYNGWVFTGNRFGAVDVFKCDPHAYLPCQLGKCDLIFARVKDLELHALMGRDHDLPSDGSKCTWRSCREKIPLKSSLEAIKCHIKEHIQATIFQDAQQWYNFTL